MLEFEVPSRKADQGRTPPKVPQGCRTGGGGGGSLPAELQRQKKKLVKVATVKAKVNVVHTKSDQEAEPIDGPISFAPINQNRVIVPHYDALVLILCINGFDVHRVLVDPGSATYLLQLPAFT